MMQVALQELGEALRGNRLERAEQLCSDLLASAPESVELHAVAGSLARQRGELQAALGHFSKAASLRPDLPEMQNNLGVILEDLGRHQDAVSHYREALALRPSYCEANCNLGNALRALGQNAEALECYRHAIAADHRYPDSYRRLGDILRAEGRWREAVESYRRFLELQPDHLSGWINLGGSLLALNRFQEAIAAQERAVAIEPDNADAHWNLALALLVTGDFRQGWREYEWRLKRREGNFSMSFAGRKIWDGSPLNGRTLLLRAEQGFGDALQFFRYARLLARDGARVVLECRRELLPLFSAQDSAIRCCAAGEAPPPFDTFAYLMSLPFLLGTTVDHIPAGTPYLVPDAALVTEWGGRMQGNGSVKVGLAWAGSAGYKNDASRSLSLELLQPLAALPGIELFSLQMGTAAADLAAEPWAGAVRDLSGGIRDFSDTAAIMANLDVVVSVDTAVAHLAGALGKRVLLMLPFSCEWRWLSGREDSPWYPSVRLYRQPELGNWEAVVAAVVRDLSALAVDVNALFREANALRRAGRYGEAVQAYRGLLALRPEIAEVHNNLGMTLQDQGHLGEAAACYREALALKPSLADAYSNLGTVLVSQGDRAAAIPCFQKAITLREDYIPAYVNLGSCLQYLDRPEEAVALYRRALTLDPASMELRVNLGNAYQEMMQPEQAIAVYEEALGIDPVQPQLHWNLALSLLSVGEFRRGWQEYEWRFRTESPSGCAAPRWDGGPLAGKTVLLECEQGLGDTLQFVRYAPLLAALGGQVLLQCQFPSLKPLLARVSGVAGVFARGEQLPHFDCTLPLMSLPAIFGTTLERLPATVPYLTPDLGRLALWRSKLPAVAGLKVGLVWRGGPLPRNRACPYAELSALAGLPGVTFFSLQLGEAPDPRLLPAEDLSREIADFGDTAAILANLDLLISVDTAAAHLAGGMGVPVWTMLPWACDWRWMLGRSDSPWYPTMRLFRQESRGEWQGVVARIREELLRLENDRKSRVRH